MPSHSTDTSLTIYHISLSNYNPHVPQILSAIDCFRFSHEWTDFTHCFWFYFSSLHQFVLFYFVDYLVAADYTFPLPPITYKGEGVTCKRMRLS